MASPSSGAARRYLVLRAQEGASDDVASVALAQLETLEPEPEPEPEESPAFHVNVMTPAGMQSRVTLRPDSTIAELKALVAQQEGMEATAVHRLFSPTGGPELQNTSTLRGNGISSSSLLLLSPPEPHSLRAEGSAAGAGISGGAAAASVTVDARPPARLKRQVSFSESLQELVADDESVVVPLEHAEGPLKENDGPSIDSALLDRLIVAFFEKGNIRSADGVTAFVGQQDLSKSGAAVAQRLEYIVETLKSGRRVGLLPSNARLGPEHSVRLERLLDYLNAAL
jgi:hypothetical protein